MPLFDFACRACGEEFEALVLGSGKPQCPRCQSSELTKRMSTFSTRTKSSGGGGSAGGGSKCSGCAGRSCNTCH